MVLWFDFAKGRDGWPDTALLCSLKHAHWAIFQHLHPTRHTETATQKHTRKGNRRCSDPPTRKMTQEKTKKEATDGGEKAGNGGNAHCDAQEYRVCRSSLAEQGNAETTVTLYLSVWATSGMGAHALSVRWSLMWTEERDPVRSDPGELHLDKHM